MRPHASSRFKPCGFTLTELAIVLGVIGIILAGAWAAMRGVSESAKRERTLEDIQMTVDGTRSFYAAQPGIPDLGYPDITSQLLQAGAIPIALRRPAGIACSNPGGYCADHVFTTSAGTRGTYRVCGWRISVSNSCRGALGRVTPHFGIDLEEVPVNTCIALVQNVTSSMGSKGLAEVNINGVNLLGAVPINPVTPDDARTYCTRNDPASVIFVYRVADSVQ